MSRRIEEVYRYFGLRVGHVRTALGMTQEQLAAKVGLTRTSITNIEAGRQRVLLADVCRFAKVFQLKPFDLMREVWK